MDSGKRQTALGTNINRCLHSYCDTQTHKMLSELASPKHVSESNSCSYI